MFKLKKYESVVKCYARKNSNQYLITLKLGHPFKSNEIVYIVSKDELDNFYDDNILCENTISNLKKNINLYKAKVKELENLAIEIKEYKEKMNQIQQKYDILLNKHDKLRTSKDHLQERFNKCQNEQIKLERENKAYLVAITKIQSLNFIRRLLNRIPEDIKQLTTTIEKKE